MSSVSLSSVLRALSPLPFKSVVSNSASEVAGHLAVQATRDATVTAQIPNPVRGPAPEASVGDAKQAPPQSLVYAAPLRTRAGAAGANDSSTGADAENRMKSDTGAQARTNAFDHYEAFARLPVARAGESSPVQPESAGTPAFVGISERNQQATMRDGQQAERNRVDAAHEAYVAMQAQSDSRNLEVSALQRTGRFVSTTA